MKISLWSVGKGNDSYVKDGIEEFTKRIAHYYPVEWNIIPPSKNAHLLSEAELRKKEGSAVLQVLKQEDFLVALDERGTPLSSIDLSLLIVQKANESVKNMVFLIGGAFGLHEDVLIKANFRWSLSRLTFPHQLVRLILAEQVYRACSIARNEKYHHR
jgi:23S rRNA (pseudouridine1915-N3)-methyltransferase